MAARCIGGGMGIAMCVEICGVGAVGIGCAYTMYNNSCNNIFLNNKFEFCWLHVFGCIDYLFGCILPVRCTDYLFGCIDYLFGYKLTSSACQRSPTRLQ